MGTTRSVGSSQPSADVTDAAIIDEAVRMAPQVLRALQGLATACHEKDGVNWRAGQKRYDRALRMADWVLMCTSPALAECASHRPDVRAKARQALHAWHQLDLSIDG